MIPVGRVPRINLTSCPGPNEIVAHQLLELAWPVVPTGRYRETARTVAATVVPLS
jgi:hypothetical protein